jgi:DNA repair photolyase
MKVPRLKVIYQPDGKTLEYAELGLNPYSSCSHDCRYCYNKRTDRPHGAYDQPRKDILKNIQHDLQILQTASDRRPVHISFVGDPYDMGRRDNDKPKGLDQFLGDDSSSDSFMRSILKTFRAYDQPFQILTKGGMLAANDFDLYGANDRFGVTLTFNDNANSKQWEPGAALPVDRIAALKEADSRNIRTWVSMEPVIDPAQTLNLIEMTYEFVDLFWVGKLNRHPNATWAPAPEWPSLDWAKFRGDVEALLKRCGKEQGTGYRLKHQLVEAR